MNYSAAHSHEAQVETACAFKALCQTSETIGEIERVKKLNRSMSGAGGVPMKPKTHRRVPRMTSSMDPAALDWLRLGTSGRRVRGGGFRRRPECAGWNNKEELCSSIRRGRGLLEGTTLEPGLWHCRSSGSLCGEGESGAQSMNAPPAADGLCQTIS